MPDTWLAGGRTCRRVCGVTVVDELRHRHPRLAVLGQDRVAKRPHVTVEIDLADAEAAKSRHPRYVPDCSRGNRTGTRRMTP